MVTKLMVGIDTVHATTEQVNTLEANSGIMVLVHKRQIYAAKANSWFAEAQDPLEFGGCQSKGKAAVSM